MTAENPYNAHDVQTQIDVFARAFDQSPSDVIIDSIQAHVDSVRSDPELERRLKESFEIARKILQDLNNPNDHDGNQAS